MHVTLQQLAYFVALAEVRSFTGAADLLRVAQPTLSRQFKVLEDELGAPLVQRTRGAVTLTPAGEAVLPLAQRMLADMEAARVAVAELVGLQRGRVRVGATPSLCIGVLADVLRVFHERYPAIHLELAENGSQLLVRSLLRNEIDIALVIVPAEGLDPGLNLTPVLRERLSVASPASSEKAPSSRGAMTVKELARRALVVPRRGYDLREVTLRAYADAGVTPRFAVEGGEMDAVLRLVEAGTGVAVVPDLVFAGRPRLRRTTLNPPLYRTVALARRADLTPSQAVQAFCETLLEFLGELSEVGGRVGDVQVLARAVG